MLKYIWNFLMHAGDNLIQGLLFILNSTVILRDTHALLNYTYLDTILLRYLNEQIIFSRVNEYYRWTTDYNQAHHLYNIFLSEY